MTDEGNKAYGRGQVIEIIHSVINKMDEPVDDRRAIYVHMAELAETIDSLRKDIARTSPHHVKNSHVPDATDELDAVIVATAEATNAIMGVCEGMEALAASLSDEQQGQLTALVTQIYEACTFQDVTGQRIRKVVTTLRSIEEKVDNIMATLDEKVGLMKQEDTLERIVSVDDEQSLLNGPQMAGKAISQDDIDKLLAEFDN
jgi:chemotaxis protein CheZ